MPGFCRSPGRFQFALPRGERRYAHSIRRTHGRFQFALPRGERPVAVGVGGEVEGFQFALPRGERRRVEYCACRNSPVSIRAPARGATLSPPGGARIAVVSIRAPARGATMVVCNDKCGTRFQFALPRGERRPRPGAPLRERVVSIRAPARGATCRHSPRHPSLCRFNSRSREGSDFFPSMSLLMAACFNSRSREGSDRR